MDYEIKTRRIMPGVVSDVDLLRFPGVDTRVQIKNGRVVGCQRPSWPIRFFRFLLRMPGVESRGRVP